MEVRKYIISVLPSQFDENLIEYSDAINWSYSNLDDSNVMVLSLEDIIRLEDIFDIINEVNDSMIGPYEDSWVPIQNDRITILNKIKNYFHSKPNLKKDNVLLNIIRLFEAAIETDHNIYFLF